ncbi:MAG: DUF937 domain-containing protein [Lysobacter sp.]|jgi:hypothetical protein|uniref:DUF937 domain-containing protein n=1 Tax=Novilysobacter luteus TaxID=2822368 RepID=A0ABM8UEZ0_9GAMM|nr:DUF937 domain-containing protein [Lysobacter luteus]MDV3256009.1 DUF937 domain-containing protein [Lysobacter sp.]MDV5982006.1 DUF937 domain-containing protein [Lysobacter sp.]CAG4972222.1 hypothetical protein LYB30171_01155 [Lysobacter luteus]
MQINDIIAQTGGLSSMARELGISEQQAATGASALLPAIMGGFRKQAQGGSGGAGLAGLLGQLGGGSLLEEVLSPQPTPVGHGNNVLGEIFGSKDVSRAVAQDASARTGLDSSLLKKMLPMLAMLAAGYMARQNAGAAGAQQGGGLGGLLGGLMGGSGGAAGTAGGLGALAGLLDADGDGNPLDDILGRLGR